MIYFLQRANGDIKIGYTFNLEKRKKAIEKVYGNLELLGTMEGERQEERILHTHFSEFRVGIFKTHEWFSSSDEIKQFIQENASVEGHEIFDIRTDNRTKRNG